MSTVDSHRTGVGWQTDRMITLVDRAEILALRRAVLRPNLPPETAEYPEDENHDVIHLAARDETGTVIGCVTFFGEPTLYVPDATGWRFRGMATAPEHRNRGLGGELLEAGVAEVASRGATAAWCNGRSAAANFYRRHGFVSHGPEFNLEPAGLHYVFVRILEPALDPIES
jgi:GNAT superfamily N-acetyltransferase